MHVTRGVPLITCSRCGKENQDHYKFCLGCGNELRSAPRPEAKPPGRDVGTTDPVRTRGTGPEVVSGTLDIGVSGRGPNEPAYGAPETPVPVLTPKPKSGIPWNDSPRMPSPAAPVTSPPLAAAEAFPRGGGGFGASGSSAPNSVAGLAAPGLVGTPAPMSASAQLTPPPLASGSPPATGAQQCPSCGRAVPAGFMFCGSCGARVASPSPGPAAVGARTAFAGSPAPTSTPLPRGRLILIRPDGSEGGAHPLHEGENLIGRGQGPLFDGDLYLSPRHAEFILGPNGAVVRDLRSLNGVFVKLTAEEPLHSSDIFRIGQELLRFDVIAPPVPLDDGTEVAGTPNPGFWGRLSVIVGRDVDGSAFPLFGDSIVLGRERGDILFPEDGYVSGTHARISLRDGEVFLADLGSSNGTFLRIRGERAVPTGAYILMGQQLFRAELR